MIIKTKTKKIILCPDCINQDQPQPDYLKERTIKNIGSMRLDCFGCDSKIQDKFYILERINNQ